jgi:prephenate dehydrogenase
MTIELERSPFSRVGIIGLGLMGGSLARGLKTLPTPPHIRALSLDPADLEEGLAAGVVDEGMGDPKTFFDGLDLVAYCTPLNAALHLLEDHRHLLDPGTLITDVVSLKAPVLEKARALDLQTAFVGSHPMVGGERRGFPASSEGLFIDAKVWIVAGEAPPESVARVEEFWTSLGAHGVRVAAEEHDAMMVWISHLPQLTANALARALGEQGIRREDLGPGGKAMTRLSGSAPEMWKDLLEHAPKALPAALEAMEGALFEIRSLIRQGRAEEVAELLRRTRDWYEGEAWN